MEFSAKRIKRQLALLRPIAGNLSLSAIRKGQNAIGELMSAMHHKEVIVKEHDFGAFQGAWMIPKDECRDGTLLYLHGGGYVCGSLDYAKGVAATLAVQCGVRVFCFGYRLAPEHPYPAALEDTLAAYRYLEEKGYPPEHITLVGESAGGGLCYALCLKLKELGEAMPAGIIAISPWTDLTASGASYTENPEKDVSMTKELLDFFAKHYTDERENPYVSPLFADLTGMPPSLLFVGGDEIMRSDTEALHEKLLASGCRSQMTVAPERWHAYVLYNLKENKHDFNLIRAFLSREMSPANKLRWMRLDNAAKIYPAARRENWSNVFRVSATLRDEVDTEVLRSALDVTVRRFPSMAVRLRRGMFWYYLEQLSSAPQIREEASYPLVRMSKKETGKCALRVLVYRNRIAIELFHALTDGTGAMTFLKTLLAEYLQQKYGARIPPENGILGRLEDPSEEEMEDSFLKYTGDVSANRSEHTAWHLSGTVEHAGYMHLTCFKIPVATVLEQAHAHGVSLTVFLAAVMMMALQNMQKEQVPKRKSRRPIKVLLPVNLRNLFPSKTLRNFALYTTPEIETRLGEYDFAEICKVIQHHMGFDVTPKRMASKIAANVSSEKNPLLKATPLFLKNVVMRMVFDTVGECKSCLSLSNLGAVRLPEQMQPYIERFDFILGVQARAPHNCGVVSYGDTLYVNFIRNIREPTLEAHFHAVLRDMGIPVEVESNQSGSQKEKK